MACASLSLSSASTAAANEIVHFNYNSLRRSDSAGELRYIVNGMRRSRSEPQLKCYSLSITRAAVTEPSRLKKSTSSPMLPFSFSIRSFLFDSDDETIGSSISAVDYTDEDEIVDDVNVAKKKKKRKVNWIQRLLELRTRWRDRQQRESTEINEADYVCSVNYDFDNDDKAPMEVTEWDQVSFSKLLSPVGRTETEVFSMLAFLCNMAYTIPEIKADYLRECYGLRLVTSSLEKKAKLENDSVGSPRSSIIQAVAYDIAASAAAHVRSSDKTLELHTFDQIHHDCSSLDPKDYNSEVAAQMAASTMTAVVFAEEEAKQQAAKDLRSLHSAPCEWFVCDDPETFTRCFVIQGSDSLASWQANLFFEPTKFEGTEAMVHRGIYEAAKGIYKQFLPEIESHLHLHGDRARFQFTGHSLGGSLSVLVSLMLLARRVLRRIAVLPIVTFGSPSIFCGGARVLDELGLDEAHVVSVMMHRDIVPRAFSCNYPNHVAQVLKRLNAAFRSHPCLNADKLLYWPLGKQIILQPDEQSSPSHVLLPPGAALYSLKDNNTGAVKAFLNTPHPLETLSDPHAYGSDGTIVRDHDSNNYLKAINYVHQLNYRFIKRPAKESRRWKATGLPKPSWASTSCEPQEVASGV